MAYQSFSQQEFERQFFSELDRRMNQDHHLRQQYEDIISLAWRSIPQFREWIQTRGPANGGSLNTRPVPSRIVSNDILPIGSLSAPDVLQVDNPADVALFDDTVFQLVTAHDGSTPLRPEMAGTVLTPSGTAPGDPASGYDTLARVRAQGDGTAHSRGLNWVDDMFDFDAFLADEVQTGPLTNGSQLPYATDADGVEKSNMVGTPVEDVTTSKGKRRYGKSRRRT